MKKKDHRDLESLERLVIYTRFNIHNKPLDLICNFSLAVVAF